MSRLKPRTLRGRLVLWFVGVLGVTLLAFGGAVFYVNSEEGDEAPQATPENDAEERRLLIALLAGFPAALAVAAVGGWMIARRALRPLDAVVRVTADLGADQLDRRVPRDGDPGQEIDQLTHSLNNMLERLQHSVEGMRRFTSDASHELRSPLAAAMGEIEVTLRRPRTDAELRATLETTLEELGRLSRLVDSLLTLARSDAGELPLERARVDAADVTRRALEPYEALAATRAIALTWSHAGEVHVQADPLWLGRAVANLIDNACKFTPPGGHVAVSVTHADDRVRIKVADSGPGISAAHRERVFERFYRADFARGAIEGFGLGLPLARQIAHALGGEISVGASTQGGAELCLSLPAA